MRFVSGFLLLASLSASAAIANSAASPAASVTTPAAFPAAPAASSVTIPAAIPAEAAPAASEPPATPLPHPILAELNDGSKVEFDSDGSVMIIHADGSKTVAPDGVLALKDGTPFVVKDGKRVSEE